MTSNESCQTYTMLKVFTSFSWHVYHVPEVSPFAKRKNSWNGDAVRSLRCPNGTMGFLRLISRDSRVNLNMVLALVGDERFMEDEAGDMVQYRFIVGVNVSCVDSKSLPHDRYTDVVSYQYNRGWWLK